MFILSLNPLYHTRILYIFLLSVISITVSCSDKGVRSHLDKAERLMEESPDSAAAELSYIDPSALRSSSNRALYALLKSQAGVKLNLTPESDSLISEAAEYYSSTSDIMRRMKSQFYLGYIRYTMGEDTKAMPPAWNAYDISLTTGDDYWRAKCAELVGFLFSLHLNHEEAKKYFKEASDYYKASHKTVNHLFSLCDMSTSMVEPAEYPRAEELLDSIYTVATTEETDSFLIAYTVRCQYGLHYVNRNYSKGYPKLQQLFSLSKYVPIDAFEFLRYSEKLILDGDTANAARQLETARKLASTRRALAGYFFTKSLLAQCKLDFKSAIRYNDSLIMNYNEEVKDILRKRDVETQRDFFASKLDKEKARHRETKFWIIAGSSLILVLILSVIYYFRTQIKRRRIEMDHLIADMYNATKQLEHIRIENSKLSRTIDEQQGDISALESRLNTEESKPQEEMEQLFRQGWTTLNMLCGEYFEKGDNQSLRTSILNNIEKELGRLRSKKNISAIKEAVNRYMDGCLDRLQVQCPALKEDDITFIGLIYAGFSPKAVCLFLDIKLKNFYTRRSRLAERIMLSGSPEAEDLVARLKQ